MKQILLLIAVVIGQSVLAAALERGVSQRGFWGWVFRFATVDSTSSPSDV